MKYPEKYRLTTGQFSTKPGEDCGMFIIPNIGKPPLKIICSPPDGEWQHVSVSLPNRCPTWKEMNRVKNLFWNESETVIQFHPKKTEYVNNHQFCLHLWKHRDGHELPPSILV